MNLKKIKSKAQLGSIINNSHILTVNTGLKWCGLHLIFSHKTGSERRKKNNYVFALTLGTWAAFTAADTVGAVLSSLMIKFAQKTIFLVARIVTTWKDSWASTHGSLCLKSLHAHVGWTLSVYTWNRYCIVWFWQTENICYSYYWSQQMWY